MAQKRVTIESVLAGWSPSEYFSVAGQFSNSVAIDPEMPKDDNSVLPSGLIRPTAMSKFSGTSITGVPLWFLNDNKNTNTYLYANDGKVHAIDSDIAMSTDTGIPATLSTSKGNGASYYNNYLYFATNTDVSRYGPLSGTKTFNNTFWTVTLNTVPLPKASLANKTYPSINGVEMPNHTMFVHPSNNFLYFCDVDGSNTGRVSYINTVIDGGVEGAIDSVQFPSAQYCTTLYANWYPTCLANFNNELAIGIISGTDTKIKQGNAQVAFWDITPGGTQAYQRIATLPDPLVTAMANVNGVLYVFSGAATGGMRISRYLGGQSFEEIYYAPDQFPPLQSAVDYQVARIVWGSNTTKPVTSGSVFAIGSKSKALSMGVHNILRSSSNGYVTACKYVTQGADDQPIIGWKSGTTYGLDKQSTTYGTSVWRSSIYRVGQAFNLKNIRLSFVQPIGANHILTVTTYVDDASTNFVERTITNSTDPGARHINIPCSARGENNFFVELQFGGPALLTVNLPMLIDFETEYD